MSNLPFCSAAAKDFPLTVDGFVDFMDNQGGNRDLASDAVTGLIESRYSYDALCVVEIRAQRDLDGRQVSSKRIVTPLTFESKAFLRRVVAEERLVAFAYRLTATQEARNRLLHLLHSAVDMGYSISGTLISAGCEYFYFTEPERTEACELIDDARSCREAKEVGYVKADVAACADLARKPRPGRSSTDEEIRDFINLHLDANRVNCHRLMQAAVNIGCCWEGNQLTVGSKPTEELSRMFVFASEIAPLAKQLIDRLRAAKLAEFAHGDPTLEGRRSGKIASFAMTPTQYDVETHRISPTGRLPGETPIDALESRGTETRGTDIHQFGSDHFTSRTPDIDRARAIVRAETRRRDSAGAVDAAIILDRRLAALQGHRTELARNFKIHPGDGPATIASLLPFPGDVLLTGQALIALAVWLDEIKADPSQPEAAAEPPIGIRFDLQVEE